MNESNNRNFDVDVDSLNGENDNDNDINGLNDKYDYGDEVDKRKKEETGNFWLKKENLGKVG